MSIQFHCKSCNKKIVAKDSMGGKWGKCPACHNQVYIPDMNADISDLKLAPLDEQEEQRRQQMLRETFQLEQEILQQSEDPGGEIPAEKNEGPELSETELRRVIIDYLRACGDGKTNEAVEKEGLISANITKSRDILDSIAMSDMPEPELSDIPPGVLAGYIRDLRGKIS